MLNERRTEPRETLAVPVLIGEGEPGVTRDISASGLFFQADRERAVDSVLDIELTLASPHALFRFVTQGCVLRTERHRDRLGVAVKLLTTRMEMLT